MSLRMFASGTRGPDSHGERMAGEERLPLI